MMFPLIRPPPSNDLRSPSSLYSPRCTTASQQPSLYGDYVGSYGWFTQCEQHHYTASQEYCDAKWYTTRPGQQQHNQQQQDIMLRDHARGHVAPRGTTWHQVSSHHGASRGRYTYIYISDKYEKSHYWRTQSNNSNPLMFPLFYCADACAV